MLRSFLGHLGLCESPLAAKRCSNERRRSIVGLEQDRQSLTDARSLRSAPYASPATPHPHPAPRLHPTRTTLPTGYMFGKGIYFADIASKSAQYCYATAAANTGILLLCEVALGNPHELRKATALTAAGRGRHSVKGCGKHIPDPKEAIEVEGGLRVPTGAAQDEHFHAAAPFCCAGTAKGTVRRSRKCSPSAHPSSRGVSLYRRCSSSPRRLWCPLTPPVLVLPTLPQARPLWTTAPWARALSCSTMSSSCMSRGR